MTSKSIYYCVYRITNLVEKKHYYGYKSSKIHPTKVIGISYFSSSTDKEFILDQKQNPQNYKYKIVQIFDTKVKALAREIRLHYKFEVGVNSNFYNKVKQTTTKFDVSGKVTVKDIIGNTFLVSISDPRYISGELVSISTGKIVVKDKSGNILKIDKNDSRYISGELVSINTGIIREKLTVKNKFGDQLQVDKNDSRYISGEFVGIAKGKITVKDIYNNTFQVSLEDSRYISGELVHITTGKVLVKDIYNNILQVDKNDPRYISGELCGVAKNKVTVKDKSGNILQVDINDSRYISGEFVHINKGKAVVKDVHGNTFRVDKNDSRYISGELVGINTGICHNFRYYYRTPFGTFDNHDLSKITPNLSSNPFGTFCKYNTRIMTKRIYNNHEILKNTFTENDIGKSFKELGFWTIPKDEFQAIADGCNLTPVCF